MDRLILGLYILLVQITPLIVIFQTQENVWRRSRDFRVNAKNSQRKWGIQLEQEGDGNAEYVPTYDMPQIFRWKGYWVEVKRSRGAGGRQSNREPGGQASSTIFISIYTLNMKVLHSFVEETRARYKEVSKPNVTVHMADMPTYGPGFLWSQTKHKARRPLSSVILDEGVVESLVKDAQEFINTEQWYVEAGIPHRRGYLLYGPPGTGKTSTIYALAGELGFEIYALSLSSGFVDDSFLQKAASSVPKHSILLIEDIDCAFPSREETDELESGPNQPYGMVRPGLRVTGQRSAVTLSGLLNVIDGVASEEGKLFFATTNYLDRLDPALLRPGRIDMKIQYKFSTKAQAAALFMRFFARDAPANSEKNGITHSIAHLATQFAAHIPEHEFSTAELQGFLLSCKKDPLGAVGCAEVWVAAELRDRHDQKVREEKRKVEIREKRQDRERKQMEGAVATFGGIVSGGLGKMVSGARVGGPVVGMPTGPGEPPGRVTGRSLPDVARTPPTPSPAYEAVGDNEQLPVLPLAELSKDLVALQSE
ncbi:hypothetical protein H0H81_001501 [Sphagnurus paluster]|uniref:P-loop containing nucleoside triphosphate hydrolase protein n=1 Tax=Sphagnurus paluster TaxID=117069 RepID=A0A9P7GM82_9AGAR|nr:hypothetical protein H0H81_001501 [Sphagnurus paluster]